VFYFHPNEFTINSSIFLGSVDDFVDGMVVWDVSKFKKLRPKNIQKLGKNFKEICNNGI